MDIMKLLYRKPSKYKCYFCLVDKRKGGSQTKCLPGCLSAMKDAALILCPAQIVQFAFCMTLLD